MAKTKDRELFKQFTEDAAQLERNGNFAKAQEAWERAARWARNVANVRWCKSRAEFCERCVLRPFKGE